ncbi:AAA family ATPase [Modestobacter sp. I12A-02628]|uniref:ATP-binding protein n=1 Tax=Goekera deserti TaxID=2497753 RepID=A0A7K3WCH1_9ACTN|nr:ATP-binding protein [Goekera deserti]MPQ98489.1 AAA family ATPase [Goekera deserti]NDI48318.1 AAA family ATPase [Goekera deserti]NEL54067.1 ATP-binding protein [Goekera deserti]
MLVLIGGLPGVGKTTLARELAGRLRAAHVRIDAVEAALVRSGLVAGQDDVGGAGYELALAMAGTCLQAGTDVVVDAVFPVAASRAPFAELAAATGTPVRWVRLVCGDRAEHRRRVEQRHADLPGHVVPSWQQVARRDVDAWTEPHVVVDTAGPDPLGAVEAALTAALTPEATRRTGRIAAATVHREGSADPGELGGAGDAEPVGRAP